MKLFKKSLIFNIGIAVLLVEFVVLCALGLFYTERFSHEVDRRIENSVQLPGKLMSHQLLRYESVAEKDVMIDLVGDEFIDAMIIGADGRVYYSYRPEFVGEKIINIPDITYDRLYDVTEPTLYRDMTDGKEIMISISPVIAFEGAKPFFLVYIKAGTEAARLQRERNTALFIFGSFFCILLTSVFIISYSRQKVITPLRELKQSADSLSQGDLDVHIPSGRKDEIGSLASSFSDMRDSIRQKIQELEQTNLALEEREGRLNALVDAFPDRIVLLDWEGQYVNIHAADRCDLFIRSTDMAGRKVHDVHPKQLADRAIDVVRKTIASGESMEIEYSLKGPDGDVWFEGRTSRIGDEDGEDGKVVWVARDITDRRRMAESLTRAKEDAEKVSVRLRELDQTKSTLVSSVSHELRTPLTSLLGFSKLILKNFATHFWPMAKEDHKLLTKGAQIIENLNILIHEGNRLTRLINDVLDLNKIEMGYTEWREDNIKPADLAHKAAKSVSGQFDGNPNISLATDIDSNLPNIVVDGDRMLQVLLNLLTNAAKFTSSGTVTLSAALTEFNTLRFAVSDTGPGIPEHEQERIFDIFHQAGNSGPADDKPRGAGLGLAICRNIVEHHNGTIWVESEVGKGSTFIVELPV